MAATDDRLLTRHHQLLLRVAGWAPDDVVSNARGWLGEGRVTEAARAVLGAVLAGRVPLRPEDANLLIRALPDAEQTALPADAAAEDDWPAYGFAPVRPSPDDFAPAPPLLDLTLPGSPEPGPQDAVAIASVVEVTAAVALWRAWRFPQPGRDEEDPVPVYVLETAGDAATLPGVTAWLQNALEAAGLTNPQVEAYAPGVELAAYQEMARGRSALLWAAEPPHPVTVARAFDSYSPMAGGAFAADHPLLAAGDEPAKVRSFLKHGTVLLASAAKEIDVFDPDDGPQVPTSFRTDGHWIWADTIAYYLGMHSLRPEEDFLAHIRACDYTPATPGPVALHRAMYALSTPGPQVRMGPSAGS
ncbi:hypothetical protein [Winogradskya humida]|uniref:Uncharacterized protein n=1 Tax=Winogradskya humida TaxID=113566 RepID=A0ABQ3ZNJ8_9ACTN|nr:hypothetical protein [Actinoplanes humidus]GIE19777.1 hypothetical protein Ahu01nite_028790 [Actinoplanes humidus]